MHSIAQNFVLAIFLDHPKDNPKCNLYSSTFVHKTGFVTHLSTALSQGLPKDALAFGLKLRIKPVL